MLRAAVVFALIAAPVSAETLVAARTVRSHAILAASDLSTIEKSVPGSLQSPAQAIGLEARVVLYAGRPIRPEDVGPAAIVERNQIVIVQFRRGPLSIAAEGRALGRAGIGDMVRVMNLASRSTVSGMVQSDGTVQVGGPDPLISQ